MPSSRKALIYALLAVLFWSTVATAFKLSLRYLEPVQLLFYASLSSTFCLGGILLVQGRWRSIFTCSSRQYARSFAMGLLNPFLYYLILFRAYDLLPAQVAQPLNYTWALTLSLLSVPLLGQSFSLPLVCAGLTCYSGVVWIITGGGFLPLQGVDIFGVFLALGSTLIWALYWIFNTCEKRDPVLTLFLNFSFSLPLSLLWCVMSSSLVPSGTVGLWGAFYIGLFEMGITFVLWLLAMRHASASGEIANLIFLSPFLSLIFIHFVAGEHIRASTVWGLMLIIGGLAFQAKVQSAPNKKAVPDC